MRVLHMKGGSYIHVFIFIHYCDSKVSLCIWTRRLIGLSSEIGELLGTTMSYLLAKLLKEFYAQLHPVNGCSNKHYRVHERPVKPLDCCANHFIRVRNMALIVNVSESKQKS